MIKFDNIRLLETSLVPYFFCDTKTAEKFISALQYQEFLRQELIKTDVEIKQLCMNIEKKISYSTSHKKNN